MDKPSEIVVKGVILKEGTFFFNYSKVLQNVGEAIQILVLPIKERKLCHKVIRPLK